MYTVYGCMRLTSRGFGMIAWMHRQSLLVASLMGLVLVLILTVNAVVLHRMQTTLKTNTGKLQSPWSPLITPEVRRKKAL